MTELFLAQAHGNMVAYLSEELGWSPRRIAGETGFDQAVVEQHLSPPIGNTKVYTAPIFDGWYFGDDNVETAGL